MQVYRVFRGRCAECGAEATLAVELGLRLFPLKLCPKDAEKLGELLTSPQVQQREVA